MEKEDREKRLEDNIFKILVENLCIMKLFRVNDKIFNDVKNYYIQIYKIDKELLRKEINYFYKENNFAINEENEKQLIKGENKDYILQCIKEKDKNEIIVDEKSEDKKEEIVMNEDNKNEINEIKIVENNNSNKIEVKDENNEDDNQNKKE